MARNIFKGAPSDDVTEFIREVRSKAFDSGKIHDDGWMADYASTCFSEGAERWYDSLPPRTKESWSLLHEALEEKYEKSSGSLQGGGLGQGIGGGLGQGIGGGLQGGGLGQGIGGGLQGGGLGQGFNPQLQPVPGGLGQGFARRGRIRVDAANLSGPNYVTQAKWTSTQTASMFVGCHWAEPKKDTALIVIVEDTAKPDHKLLRLENGSYLGVALVEQSTKGNLGNDPDHWGALIDTDKEGRPQGQIAKMWAGETKATGWEIHNDGSLTFHWDAPNGTSWPMVASYTNKFQGKDSPVFVEVVVDLQAYLKKYTPEWKEAKYTFEDLH